MPSVASAARAHAGQTGVSRASARRLANTRARHCCQRGRSTPKGRTPGANHQRMASTIAAGIERPVGVAHRQPNAADLGVEAAGPRHDDGDDGERQGEPVEADRYPRSQRLAGQSQSWIRHLQQAPPLPRRLLILQAISHRLHFETAVHATTQAPRSRHRVDRRGDSSPPRSPGSSTATSSASDSRLPGGSIARPLLRTSCSSPCSRCTTACSRAAARSA